MTVETLIKDLQSGDKVAAQASFNATMANKLTHAIDAKKIEVAGSLGKVDKTLDQE
jgi:hypothetical protein|tara:strand:+ start:921 stop:1088 length:168 start_codon:yes stop_codon:yes gene_type:complete